MSGHFKFASRTETFRGSAAAISALPDGCCHALGARIIALDIDASTTVLAGERFDDCRATKHVGRSAMRTGDTTNLIGSEFHQSQAGTVHWNRIDYSAARVAPQIDHIAPFRNQEATVAICASGDFVADGQVPGFVYVHLG